MRTCARIPPSPMNGASTSYLRCFVFRQLLPNYPPPQNQVLTLRLTSRHEAD